MPQEKVRETASIEEKLRKRLSSGERANKMRAGTAESTKKLCAVCRKRIAARDFAQVVRGKQENVQEIPDKGAAEVRAKESRREKSDAFDKNHVGMRSSLA